MNLKKILENEILDFDKVTELFCDGKSIWKGFSNDLYQIAEKYEFIKFDSTKNNTFNEAFYKIIVTPVKPIFENRLPKDKDTDPEFGLPEEKKFPLFDKAHVESAIKFFNYVDEKNEKMLADKIIEKMKNYNIPFDMVGENNKLKKYIPEKEKVVEESFNQAYRDSGEKEIKHINGRARARVMAIIKNNKEKNKDLDEIGRKAEEETIKAFDTRVKNKAKKQEEAKVFDKHGNEVVDDKGKSFKTKDEAKRAITSGKILNLKKGDNKMVHVVGTPSNINKKDKDDYRLANIDSDSTRPIKVNHKTTEK